MHVCPTCRVPCECLRGEEIGTAECQHDDDGGLDDAFDLEEPLDLKERLDKLLKLP